MAADRRAYMGILLGVGPRPEPKMPIGWRMARKVPGIFRAVVRASRIARNGRTRGIPERRARAGLVVGRPWRAGSGLFVDVDDLAGARLDKHRPVVHDRVAVGPTDAELRRERPNRDARRQTIADLHLIAHAHRRRPLRDHVLLD